MSPGRDPPTDRESPVGEPVVRGDAAVLGREASDAVEFDPEDPESLERAATTVERFAEDETADLDSVHVLRGAAAAAALARGEGSYRAAADRTGASVPLIRKWARVHDLPRSVRRRVAAGEIAPSAAKHVARLEGEDRFAMAWATLEADLTVREVRRIASQVDDGTPIEEALAAAGVDYGRVELDLPSDVYRELRRRAALTDRDPDAVAVDALREYLGDP
ncbi:hypothetical protein BRD00_03300 [Halobacteriales archaeon QS_8_69_26]|nr:MAG: hypothetical protein BRD00_03300 [Halobacteriales archaeon QS_8_69_26]